MPVKCWIHYALVSALLVVTSGVAQAHPLGNFTINHLAEVTPHRGSIGVRYVLDIAEIPTFQIMHARSADGTWNAAAIEEWANDESAIVTAGLDLEVDGRPLSLTQQNVRARLRPGAGGLPILYWTGDYSATITPSAHQLVVRDNVYADRRIGWKDIIVLPQQSEPTHELQLYPNALIGSPRRIASVAFMLQPSGVASAIVGGTDEQPDLGTGNSLARSSALTDMFGSSNRTPYFILLTMLVAFGLGALHAIEPGHGKALLAFTLVGSRATVGQAAILAASLTFAHTVGVFVLGFVLFFATGFVSETIYAWITLVSGVVIAIIGARSLARYLRRHNIHFHGNVHAHADEHTHDHDFTDDHHHGDGSDHGHSHAIPGDQPLNFGSAIWAAMSGGIAPCPAALVVMLAALRLHQLGYGMVLIVIFSMGLASVLTGLGIAVVHGASFLQRDQRFERLVKVGPLASAILISIVGSVMIGQGFLQQGVHVSLWIIAGLAAIAIASYALTPAHAHRHEVQPT